MKNIISLLTLIAILFSCKKDSVPESTTTFGAISGSVYISNEGNFQSGNASISYFNPINSNVSADAYKEVNNQSLGDICQSLKMINSKLFLVVNNSGKIVVCDPFTMKKITAITGLTSPRYIVSSGNNKAYVSDAYSNQVSIIDLNNNTISGTISINGWTEQMLLKDNKVYVTNSMTNYLYIINTANDNLSDSILISKGANSICEDVNGKIWVLCGGDYLNTFNGALYKINPTSNQIETNFQFPSNQFPMRLCIDGSQSKLYFINSNIYKMDISDSLLPNAPFITSIGNSFYGLSIDKKNDIIYISDAIDYIQKGKIIRYRNNGSVIDNFNAGIIPGDFLFLD